MDFEEQRRSGITAFKIAAVVLAMAVSLLAVLLLVNQRDEELNPEIVALQAPQTLESLPAAQNAYYAVTGFAVKGVEDFHGAGVRMVEQYLAKRKDGFRAGNLSELAGLEEIPASKEMNGVCTLSDGPFVCLDAVSAQADRAARFVEDQHEMLRRYAALAAYPGWQNPIPDLDDRDPAPTWSRVMMAAQALRLDIALQVQRGDVAGGLQRLATDVLTWRRWLLWEHTALIGKMVMVNALTADYLMLVDIIRHTPSAPPASDALQAALAPITDTERDLRSAFKDEFVIIGRAATRERVVEAVEGWQGKIASWFFLPNATRNQDYQDWQSSFHAAAQPCSEFPGAKQQIKGRFTEPSWISRLYNPAGKYILDMARGGYFVLDYLGRSCDLVGFQRLAVVQWQAKTKGIPDSEVGSFIAEIARDPYSGAPMIWDAQRRTLSFAVQDKRNRKLLPSQSVEE